MKCPLCDEEYPRSNYMDKDLAWHLGTRHFKDSDAKDKLIMKLIDSPHEIKMKINILIKNIENSHTDYHPWEITEILEDLLE